MLGTLAQVAQMGLAAVEFAGFAETPVTVLRAALDKLHLRAAGAHVPYAAFDTDLQRVCEDLVALGCEYAIVPSIPPAIRDGARTLDTLPRLLEQWARVCQDAGLRFAYHNHDFEFAPLDAAGTTLFDALSTDTTLVDLEVDVFWAEYAGRNAVELIQRHADRVRLLHLKDIAREQDPADVPLGRGTLDWTAILATADEAGVRWFIVEQDNPRDPLHDVASSMRYLEQLNLRR
jgi:sugar phosphate isomerase/epimerase